MGHRRARLDGLEDAKRAWSAWLDQRNHRKRDDWHDDLCPMCGRELVLKGEKTNESTTAGSIENVHQGELHHPAIQARRVLRAVTANVEQCENCDGTGWYGCDGPGIPGNTEFVNCDCGTATKCTAGWHKYRLIDGVAWCDKCGLEADLSVCKLTHPTL